MKEEWLAFEWPGYHIYQAIAPMKAWMFDFAKFGCPISKMAVSYSKGTTVFYILKNEYESFGEKFFIKIKNNPNPMFRVLDEIDKASEGIFRLGRKIAYLDFNKLSDRKIINIHSQLFKLDDILWRKGQIQNLLEFHNNYLTEHIKEILLNKFGKNNVNDYFEVLTMPDYKSMSKRQDEDFFKILKKYKEGIKDKSQLLKAHWKNYSWMTYGWAGPSLDLKYFEGNFDMALKSKLIQKSKADETREKIAKNKRKIIFYKLDEKEKRLVILLRSLVDMKAKRVDAHSLTYFIADKINFEIVRRKYLSVNQIRTVPPFDIEKVFKNEIGAKEMNSDYKLVVYWFEKKKIKKMNGLQAKLKVAQIISNIPKPKKTNLIKGEMAFAGKVRGKVKLILEQKDFSKFKKGDILVTRITDPSYIPIMKMAKAIITDIGGITCHAAIVSRELKKTCVIGTKIATQVLKDGDLVEVDANKGIIKKLK